VELNATTNSIHTLMFIVVFSDNCWVTYCIIAQQLSCRYTLYSIVPVLMFTFYVGDCRRLPHVSLEESPKQAQPSDSLDLSDTDAEYGVTAVSLHCNIISFCSCFTFMFDSVPCSVFCSRVMCLC